jgi:hypothetical protein
VTKGRTPEEIKAMIMEIVKALEEAGVPDDLRVTAFEKAFDAMAGTGGVASAPMPPEPTRDQRDTPTDGPSLGAIASRLGLEPDLVGEIYYVDGDSLGLALAASKFSAKKAAATQDIALLLAGGRQAGGWDEWTPSGRIRDVARDYGRYDQANFATTIRRMGDVFSFRGRGRDLEVRLTRPGYEHAANLARELGEM